MKRDSASITLVIANPGRLLHECTPAYRFHRQGGTIGSRGSDWYLDDRTSGIHSLHCEIRWHEGGFCLIDRCGATYLNGNNSSLRPGMRVRLKPDDYLHVGEYRVGVQGVEVHLDSSAHPLNEYTVAQVLRGCSCPLKQLLVSNQPGPVNAIAAPGPQELDPLALVEQAQRAQLHPALAQLLAKPIWRARAEDAP